MSIQGVFPSPKKLDQDLPIGSAGRAIPRPLPHGWLFCGATATAPSQREEVVGEENMRVTNSIIYIISGNWWSSQLPKWNRNWPTQIYYLNLFDNYEWYSYIQHWTWGHHSIALLILGDSWDGWIITTFPLEICNIANTGYNIYIYTYRQTDIQTDILQTCRHTYRQTCMHTYSICIFKGCRPCRRPRKNGQWMKPNWH